MKKKILLLSDDISTPTGVATMSREIIHKTLFHYDWVQIGGARKNKNTGKILDMSLSCQKEFGVEDAYLKVYPVDGYGDRQLLLQIIDIEKPDVIMHFTDPRYWVWLYQMAHEFRNKIPLVYYSIWDNLPYPYWNEPYYLSSDLIMSISRQTKEIIDVVTNKQVKNVYVPHGVEHNVFYPLDETGSNYPYLLKEKLYTSIFGNKNFEYIVFYNNRNARRKRPADLILAYKKFKDRLPADEQELVALLFHTDIIDENGTNLLDVVKIIAPNDNIYFTNQKYNTHELNILYNIADVTCNIANAEGFGLSNLESMMAGTMTIATVTGGLQDQMGFPTDFITPEHPSNHDGKYKEYGLWTIPLFPITKVLTGSVSTPYIFDDYISHDQIANALAYIYHIPKDIRRDRALMGRKWAIEQADMTAEKMGLNVICAIDDLLLKWKPVPSIKLTKINLEQPKRKTGIL